VPLAVIIAVLLPPAAALAGSGARKTGGCGVL